MNGDVSCRRALQVGTKSVVKDSLTTPSRPSATPPPAEEGSLKPVPRLGLRPNLIRNLESGPHRAVCTNPLASTSSSGGAHGLPSQPAVRARWPVLRSGTSSLIVEPAATKPPWPTRTGAINVLLVPMNASSSMCVSYLLRAVIVGGNDAGADIDVLPDGRVTEISQMCRISCRDRASTS